MLIIPAIDIMDGKVVRLQRGEFARQSIYEASPLEFAKKWKEEGAQLLHVVDLDGAKTGELKNFQIVEEIIKKVPVKIEVGGGIRSLDSIKKYIDTGAARVVLSTKVIEDPSFLSGEEIKKYLDKIVVSIDIKQMQTLEVVTSATEGWRKDGDVLIDIPSFLNVVSSVGVPYVNFSDIERDGMLSGPNTQRILSFLQLARTCCLKKLFFTYAGGISSLEDIKTLSGLGEDGVDAVIVGKAIYEKKFSLREAIEAVKQ